MKLRNRILETGALLLLSLSVTAPIFGQIPATAEQAAQTTADDPSGIVVEKVAKDSAAENAGLEEGDQLLRWSRGESQGELQSPFDVSLAEIEQAPRGQVTIQGLRGVDKRTWILGPSDWGLKTCPSFSRRLLLLYHQGQELAQAGKLAEAVESWRAASSQLDHSTPSWQRLWLLSHVGDAFVEARQWKEADTAYEDVIAQSEQAGTQIKGELLRLRARTFHLRGDWVNAEKYYREALVENQKVSSQSLNVAALLDQIGYSFLRRGEFVEAEKYYLDALAIQQRLAPESLAVAGTLNGLGCLSRDRGNLAKAEEYLDQALAISKQLAPNSRTAAQTFSYLGTLARRQGDLAKAEEYFRRALAIAEKTSPVSPDTAGALMNLGTVASSRGDSVQAEQYYKRALEIQEKLAPENLEIAGTLNNLGIEFATRGDLVQANEYFSRALAIQEKLAPNKIECAHSFENVGNIAYERGDLTKAEEYYNKSRAIKEKVAPGSLDMSANLGNLGIVARDRGDFRKAEEYFEQALKISEKFPGSPDMAENLTNLGDTKHANPAEAESYYSRALAIWRKLAPGGPGEAKSHMKLADVARDRGDLTRAEEYYEQARRIFEKVAPGTNAYAEVLADLASIMVRKGQLDAAALLFDQALAALESQSTHLGGSEDARSNFRARYLSYYQDYIDLLIRQKQPELAFHVLERSRAQSLLEMLAESRIDVRKGVDAALLGRERSLVSDIRAKSDRHIRLLSGRHTDEQAAAVEQEIEKLLAQRKDIEEQIRVSGPGYAALTRPLPLSAKEVQQQLLDDDTLLLAYSLGEERSYVFAVTRSSLTAYELPKRAEIERVARHVRELLVANRLANGEIGVLRQARLDKSMSEYGKAAASLSQMVLGPVAAELQQKRLLIVGDGALQYISFAALPAPTPFSPSAATSGMITSGVISSDHVPLVVEHEIVNLPSASVLAALRQETMGRKPAPKAVAVLADPVFAKDDVRVHSGTKGGKPDGEIQRGVELDDQRDGESEFSASAAEHLTRSVTDVGFGIQRTAGLYLPRLPFSRREAMAILSVTPPGEGMQALDFQASRGTATDPSLGQYRIVHFATHGLLDNEHPELSGLVLSLVDPQGKPKNGFLELEDVYNLNLSADLVVLSACETGLGKEVRGEGLVGLTRGFMYAGAPRVVASLWSVDDIATEELMTGFYKAMEQQKMAPAAALRQAQVAMWKEGRWRDPYYWAGFVLEGEWK